MVGSPRHLLSSTSWAKGKHSEIASSSCSPMKPVTQVHDALWHCLCPSFSNRAFRAFAAVPWPTRLSQQPRQRSATHKTRQYSSQQHSSTAGYGKRLRISIHARPPQPQNQLLRQNLDAATNADLHEELDRRATDGDIEWVRYLVQSLVYERSEKPDQRHYLALILANTNVDYGSAGEVKRYLDEMSSAGLSIDSAICHAVLKVFHTPDPFGLLLSTPAGAGRTPGLCPPRRHT